jgi:hypothetical protein
MTQKTPSEKDGYARIRLTEGEVKAIFAVASILDNKQLGRTHILDWSSVLNKLKKYNK